MTHQFSLPELVIRLCNSASKHPPAKPAAASCRGGDRQANCVLSSPSADYAATPVPATTWPAASPTARPAAKPSAASSDTSPGRSTRSSPPHPKPSRHRLDIYRASVPAAFLKNSVFIRNSRFSHSSSRNRARAEIVNGGSSPACSALYLFTQDPKVPRDAYLSSDMDNGPRRLNHQPRPPQL